MYPNDVVLSLSNEEFCWLHVWAMSSPWSKVMVSHYLYHKIYNHCHSPERCIFLLHLRRKMTSQFNDWTDFWHIYGHFNFMLIRNCDALIMLVTMPSDEINHGSKICWVMRNVSSGSIIHSPLPMGSLCMYYIRSKLACHILRGQSFSNTLNATYQAA